MRITKSIRDKIISSLENGNLIVVCGAGLSIPSPSNLPSAQELLNLCVKKCSTTYSIDESAKTDIGSLAGYFYTSSVMWEYFIDKLIPWDDFSRRPKLWA